MGADRGILVQTDAELQPLAVAKLFKAIVAREAPQLVIVAPVVCICPPLIHAQLHGLEDPLMQSECRGIGLVRAAEAELCGRVLTHTRQGPDGAAT